MTQETKTATYSKIKRKRTPTEIITKEIPIIKANKYEPLVRGEHKIEIQLTDKQIEFIENVAKKCNISYSEAFKKVWNDAFNLLDTQRETRKTYANLPEVNYD